MGTGAGPRLLWMHWQRQRCGEEWAGSMDITASGEDRRSARRDLPAMHRLLGTPEALALLGAHPRALVVRCMREGLAELRRREAASFCGESFFAGVADRLRAERTPGLRRVLNATGIVVHTNLGRAPLAVEAVTALVEASRGYVNLEYDLEAGRRGGRDGAVEGLLRRITGAQAALAVNNNAAAVLLALAGVAAGGEVIVSRGELVEIGGSFRIPDIIEESGCRLVEVGTTNKTRLADYAHAIGPATKAILKVHPSNYRIVGFTASVGLAELAPLARRHGLVLIEDQGSGTLVDMAGIGAPAEPTVGASVAAGADLVTFSGDKLLGGPQAGLVVGRAAEVGKLRHHPLYRALRVDKLRLAALEATLRLYDEADGAPLAVPAIGMLARDEATLERAAARLAGLLDLGRQATVSVEPSVGYAGGGAMPEAPIPSRAVAVQPLTMPADELARRLRLGEPALVGRIARGRLLLDVRTLQEAELPEAARAVREAMGCAM